MYVKQNRIIFLSIYIFILIIAANSLHAQFSVGAIGGLNFASFGGIEPTNGTYESHTGPAAGIALEYQVSQYVSVTFHPMYSVKGSNIVFDLNGRKDSTDTYNVSADYITIPIGFKIYTLGGNVYALGNFEFGFPMDITLNHNNESYSIANEFKEVDITATIGLGVKFDIGNAFLSVDFRYYQGLVNFHEESDNAEYEHTIPSFKSKGTQIMIQYMWLF